jgi:hypothetical protein
MDRNEIVEISGNPEMLFLDGMDEAFVGIAHSISAPPCACYSVEKILGVLVKGGMTEEEAQEFFDYNIACAYVGESTPIFLEAVGK